MAVILRFPDRPAAEAEATRALAEIDRLAADAHAVLKWLAVECGNTGIERAAWRYSVAADAVLAERDRIREWTAARAALEPEPVKSSASGKSKARYGKRPCAVYDCHHRVRLDIGDGDTCAMHSPEAARRREQGEVRRARERLHAEVTRMA